NPFYRIVVADSRVQRDGEPIAELGTYNTLADPAEINIDVEAAKKWLANGAKPTDTVRAILKKAGAIQ
ncbi:MAG: 30S ribosomal protein S16, partial [Firmicutes bacterium]|nr:30S ribosomal protein S16 [Bacillota bacterium]